jgi:hypothetical protein
VENVGHVIAQPLDDGIFALDIGARNHLGLDNAGMGRNLPQTQKAPVGLLHVAVAGQPVGTDNGRVKHIGAADGHVAPRCHTEQDAAEGHVVLIRSNAGKAGSGAFVGDPLDLRPIFRIGIEESEGGVAVILAILLGDFLVSCTRLVFDHLVRWIAPTECLARSRAGKRSRLVVVVLLVGFGSELGVSDNELRVGRYIDLEHSWDSGLILQSNQ